VLLPSQDIRGGSASVAEPQRRLMAAVLHAALADCRAGSSRESLFPSDRRGIFQATSWIASTDRSWPYSFENICEALGLDPDGLRRELKKDRKPC
jgi:hypothetical protein